MPKDTTNFLERRFVFLENKGRSIRLIDRDNTRQAISIHWSDLAPLRELITLALGDSEERCQHLSERDELGRAIAEAAIEIGIIDGTQPLTGPQLVLLCRDLVACAKLKETLDDDDKEH